MASAGIDRWEDHIGRAAIATIMLIAAALTITDAIIEIAIRDR
jgi:hypothetical protein